MLDWCLSVHTVTVVEINGIGAKLLETFLDCFPDVWRVIASYHGTILDNGGKFSSNEDFIAFASTLEPFANQLLAIALPEHQYDYANFV